ncbi:MAG: flotillin family protein [Gemmatimonadota bacterium]|jgi:flotillin|nr:flotillin family protein [Gemmatimonadota bacterium]
MIPVTVLLQLPETAAFTAFGALVLAALILMSVLVLFVTHYKRCPANQVLVISGRVGEGQSAICLSGGGKLVLPIIQEHAFLSLLPLTVDVNLTDALSYENIRVRVPSVFTVAIGTSPEIQQNAATRLLGLTQEEIKSQAADIIFGQMRQVIASMRIEEINRDRDAFQAHIQAALEPELRKIGLVLLNVNIKDLGDESGYIEAIGRKAAAEAVQKARGDVAEQEKVGEIRVANAEQERTIQVANASKLREIGVQEAVRDQQVRIADLEKETAIARQRAAFERDAQIALADREKRISVAAAEAEAVEGEVRSERARRVAVASADAEAIKGEATAKALIAAAEAELQVHRAEAFQEGETRKRVAEAAVEEAQNRALARAALAEAERVEAERRAELEAPARAEKARRIVEAEAAGESTRINAEAQAAATLALLRAEAQGEFEKLQKKGEGLKAIVEACGGADAAYRLLMLEHLDSLAERAAQAISNVRFDKVVVWSGGGQNEGSGTSGPARFVQDLAAVFPPVMEVMKEIGGVQLPDSVMRFVSDGEPSGGVDAGAAPGTPATRKIRIPTEAPAEE